VRICAAVPSPSFDIASAMQEALGLHRAGRLREADKLYARVLKAAPSHFDALHLSGLCKAQNGQMGEAYRLIAAALKINARAPEAWQNFANVLHALKRDREALDALDKALALRPDDPGALENRGNALLTLLRPREALASFDAAPTRDARRPGALIGRGSARAALGQFSEALADFDAALNVAPGHPSALYNRGNALFALGRYVEALAAFDAALKAAPQHVQALNNRGRALQALDRHREARESFDKAIALQKDYADAYFNRALSLLTLGDLERGFAEYEWRWRRSGMSDTRRNYRGKLWLGEYRLGGKTVLLHAEQGLGDTIQFARYVPLIARTGAKPVLEVQPALKALFATLPGAVPVQARGEPLPAYDVHCPLGSLPLACKTTADTVPLGIPYLQADAARIAKWRPALEALPGKRVALAWAGNPAHPNDRNRSLAPELLEPLLALDGLSFVSLQPDLREQDREWLARHRQVRSLEGELADFADSAAILSLCDLTLAVDTALVHLAGALARPVWILLPFAPDWRWVSDRAQPNSVGTSPWYPQARLFRQQALGDWASAIATVREALARFAAES
jgi:tetratricopeptide (TPR) repeat protein